MSEEEQKKPPSEIQVEMALSRTLLASDRTLLAWIRTSLSLFGFGFTLAKFIHGYIESGALKGVNQNTSTAIGLAMIFLGFWGLLGGMGEHVRTFRSLNISPKVTFRSPALLLAAALTIVGLYLTFDIFVAIPR